MEIEFKILEMEKSGTNRFGVKIAYKEVGSDDDYKTYPFNFTNDELKNDAFMEKIRNHFQKEFGTNPVINKEKFIGKTNYYRVRG